MPDGALRAQLEKLLVVTRESIELTVIVVPTDGLMAPLLRTAIRASVMLTGTREQLKIAASTDDAIRIVAPLLSVPASELRRRLDAAGMMVGRAAAGS